MTRSKVAVSVLVGACAACAEVLSIDDAELDPSLEAPRTVVPADGGDDASDSGSGSDAALALCDEYCSTVLDACSGAFAVYAAGLGFDHIGACCGSTDAHVAAIAAALTGV